MSLLIGPDTTFIKKGILLANRAGHYILGREVSLVIGPDTTFIRKGSVPANRAGYYIY